MASGPTQTADDLSTSMKTLVDRMLEADVRRQISQRGQEIAAMVGEATGAAAERAAEAWKESESARRDAAKRMSRAQHDAGKWSTRAWRKEVQPAMRDLWKRRAVAITAAGAALPAGRELVEDAAVRLGIRERRERRHWGAFFLGLLIGAAAGAVLALLTAPKPGRQMRDELGERGREVAGDLATRARETDWVPLFQRPDVEGFGTATVGGAAAGMGTTDTTETFSTPPAPPPTEGVGGYASEATVTDPMAGTGDSTIESPDELEARAPEMAETSSETIDTTHEGSER